LGVDSYYPVKEGVLGFLREYGLRLDLPYVRQIMVPDLDRAVQDTEVRQSMRDNYRFFTNSSVYIGPEEKRVRGLLREVFGINYSS
jgi:hypothetical protein